MARWLDKCQMCKESMWVGNGQKVYGCRKCRSAIRAHNRKWKRQHPNAPDPEKKPKHILYPHGT